MINADLAIVNTKLLMLNSANSWLEQLLIDHGHLIEDTQSIYDYLKKNKA